MARPDWRSDDWLRIEYRQILVLARLAGKRGWQGPGWSKNAIREEARAYLVRSFLFAPHKVEPTINRLVIGGFLHGWQEREQEEATHE